MNGRRRLWPWSLASVLLILAGLLSLEVAVQIACLTTIECGHTPRPPSCRSQDGYAYAGMGLLTLGVVLLLTTLARWVHRRRARKPIHSSSLLAAR